MTDAERQERLAKLERDKALLKHTPLSDEQYELMAEVEEMAEKMNALSLRLAHHPATDPQWAEIGTIQNQIGFSAWRRCIGRPKKF